MRYYATKMEVNNEEVNFVPSILTLIDDGNGITMYTRYADGSTKRYGATVQEVVDAINNNIKIVIDVIRGEVLADKEYPTVIHKGENYYSLQRADGYELARINLFDEPDEPVVSSAK